MATNSFFNEENKYVVSNVIAGFVKSIAGVLGYPKVEGMRITVIEKVQRFAFLPTHNTQFPPQRAPENFLEVIVGKVPTIDPIVRNFFYKVEDGFYNFYVINYKNLYFLPDWLSQFLQIRLHISDDIGVLEVLREVLFVACLFFYQIVTLRICLFWFISINPYTFPWLYIVGMVDWTDDALQGIVPVVAGLNLTSSFVLAAVGKCADGLNHLVFTMPFLPSEGFAKTMLLNGKSREVIMFQDLPILWYRYPIPNDLRSYWYYERPDILKWLQENYKNVDIQFYPDNIVEQLNRQPEIIAEQLNKTPQILAKMELSNLIIGNHSNIDNNLSTQLISIDSSIQTTELNNYVININQSIHSFILSHIDKFI